MASNFCRHSDIRAIFLQLSHMCLNDHQTKRYIAPDKYVTHRLIVRFKQYFEILPSHI